MNIFHKVSKQDQIDLLYDKLHKLSDDIKELYGENRELRRILENYIPGKITFVSSNTCSWFNKKTFIYKDGKEYVIDNLYLSENTVLVTSPTQKNVVSERIKKGLYISTCSMAPISGQKGIR